VVVELNMPKEVAELENKISPIIWCPKCKAPFTPFLRGQVQRSSRKFIFFGKRRPNYALICWECKDIVGWE